MDALARRVAELGWTERQPVDADADALRDLIGGVYAEYPGCVLDPDGVDADLADWASRLTTAGGTGWLVHDAAGLAACVGVAPAETPPAVDGLCVELKRLYVRTDARRQGLGRALVGRVEDWASAHGAAAVVLWSDDRFTDAHRLYERCGYRDTGRRRDLHDPSDTTEIEFVRTL